MITAEQLEGLINQRGTWLSRVVSWSLTDGPMVYSYYACWVNDLNLWFLTGAGDWYCAKGGITTEELVLIIGEQDVSAIWASTNWQEVNHQ